MFCWTVLAACALPKEGHGEAWIPVESVQMKALPEEAPPPRTWASLPAALNRIREITATGLTWTLALIGAAGSQRLFPACVAWITTVPGPVRVSWFPLSVAGPLTRLKLTVRPEEALA